MKCCHWSCRREMSDQRPFTRKSVGSRSIEFKPLATLCSSSDRCVKNVHCILRQDNKSKTVVSSSSSFSFFEKIPLKNALRIRTTIRPFKPQHKMKNRQNEKKSRAEFV